MGRPAEKAPRRATYADLEAVPANKVAELIGGVLHVMPRPAVKHARSSSVLGFEIGGRFDFGEGGPGGWWILDAPELHFPDPASPGDIEALVPDLAGWRREHMPGLPDVAAFTVAPDWICEVLNKSTEDVDRDEKMPIYAREGVAHAWLIDPVGRTIEAYVLRSGRRWSVPQIFRGEDRVRLPPFDAVELELAALWM
jgi:Uma2 family endonuclease